MTRPHLGFTASSARPWAPFVIVALGAALGCDSDDDTRVGQNPAWAGASGAAGNASNAGRGGAGGASGSAGAGPTDAGSSVDRNVFRPEEVAATPALIERLRGARGLRGACLRG